MPMLANTPVCQERCRQLARRMADLWRVPVVAVVSPPPKIEFSNDFCYVVRLADATRAELGGGEIVEPEHWLLGDKGDG